MPSKLKIEIVEGDNILEIYEKEPGKLAFAMYPDDPKNETYLEINVDTDEFSLLLKRLLDISDIEVCSSEEGVAVDRKNSKWAQY